MNSRALVGLAVTGVVVLVSCTQDKTPESLLPTEASYASAKTSCSFSDANADAKAYFSKKDDAVFADLALMQKAFIAGGAPGATEAGFTVLADLARATDAG